MDGALLPGRAGPGAERDDRQAGDRRFELAARVQRDDRVDAGERAGQAGGRELLAALDREVGRLGPPAAPGAAARVRSDDDLRLPYEPSRARRGRRPATRGTPRSGSSREMFFDEPEVEDRLAFAGRAARPSPERRRTRRSSVPRVACTRSRGMPWSRSASSTCSSFQTSRWSGCSCRTALLERLSQLQTSITEGSPSARVDLEQVALGPAEAAAGDQQHGVDAERLDRVQQLRLGRHVLLDRRQHLLRLRLDVGRRLERQRAAPRPRGRPGGRRSRARAARSAGAASRPRRARAGRSGRGR